MILTAESTDGVCTDQAVQEVTVVFPDTTSIGVSELEWMPIEGGPVPFGEGQPLQLNVGSDMDHWLMRDGQGRLVRQGGALAAGTQLTVRPEGLRSGWFILVFVDDAGRHWSMPVTVR